MKGFGRRLKGRGVLKRIDGLFFEGMNGILF